MKTLLVGINAKFVHTNLAIRNIAAYCRGEEILVYEATINDDMDDVLEDLVSWGADLIGFSCYIWNIEQVLYLAENIKKIRPETMIVLGGPEVSYDVPEIMEKNGYVDCVILGEGEERFRRLLMALKRRGTVKTIDGIAFRENGRVTVNPPLQGCLDLNDIPLSYGEEEDLSNKLVYYETSRGCPFNCAFCLSSLERNLRKADLDKVKRDFEFFAAKGVGVVKLVDRSFNCDPERAVKILDIIRTLPGETVFHCEINPELVDDRFIESLKGLEKRLRFEVGVQTTNPESLKAVSRTADVERTLRGIKLLKKAGIKLHLDLIAGLPHEDFSSFTRSFNEVYSLGPEEIQLGFLKLLKGTRLRREADDYGIRYRSKPPYEVLYTRNMAYEELRILKGISKLLERFYNDGRFQYSLSYLIKKFKSPFEMYLSFYDYCNKKGFLRRSLSLRSRYELLFEYARTLDVDHELFRDLVNFDFMFHNGKEAPPVNTRRPENKRLMEKVRAYAGDRKWLEKNFPEAQTLPAHEEVKHAAVGYFKHDVPENTGCKEIGIIFFRKDGETRYAKFQL